MDLGMLGPFEISARGQVVPLRGRRQRALIAILAVHANQAVSKDRLIDELWPEEPFDAAANSLHVTVSRTRKVLEEAVGEPRVLTKAPGYLLQVRPQELDTTEFERLLAEGRAALTAGDAATALDLLRDAEALWRGPALSDFAYEPFAQQEIARLEELRLVVIEERIDAQLFLGHSGGLTAELDSLVAAHPLRERFRAQLMLALYRSGRQGEALSAFDRVRELLAGELGLDPGPELVRLQAAILRQDPELEAARPISRVPASPEDAVVATIQPRQARRSITVLAAVFTEVGGGTLDTEVLSRIRATGFHHAAEVLRQHGAAVQPPVGDALVAIFGLPVTQEDDLLRALRAAVAVRAATAELNDALRREGGVTLVVRIGLQTGEVVGEGDGSLAAGPAAAASRLAVAADKGEILIGEAAHRLGAHAVRSELIGDGTWRLVELLPDAGAIPRHHDTPLVGRDAEIAQLEDAFERVVTERSAHVVTVMGEAGIGKTRLAEEFASRVRERAQVLTARCLSYGDDVTFSPFRELVEQAAKGQTAADIRALLADDPEAEAVAQDVAAALGTIEGSTALDPVWAFRKLLEAVARARPLVVVIDDVHWAPPPLVELIDRLAGLTDDAPILVVCAARPEMLDPTSPSADRPGGARLSLRPLTDEETEALVDNLPGREPLTPDARARIVDTAEGNPLFAEQLLAFHSGDVPGHDDVPLPPTIQALLSARLDRLGPGERACLDSAAIIGKEFWVDPVLDLLPEEARPTARRHFRALAGKQLVSPGPSSVSEEAFRFAHVLIQESTYRSISKARRAALHESVGRWLERRMDEMSTAEETIGFHLERAYRYRLELGPIDAEGDEIRSRAAKHLAGAGRAAFARSDAGAALGLLTRAAALLDDAEPRRLELSVRIAEASVECGDFELAGKLTTEVLADENTSPLLGAHAALTRLRVQIENADVREGQIAADVAEPMAVFEREGDGVGLAYALTFLARDHWLHGRAQAAAEALEETIRQAEKTGDRRRATYAAYWLSIALVYGDTPIEDAVVRCEALAAGQTGVPLLQAGLMSARAARDAMHGSFTEAHSQCARAVAILDDLGQRAEAAAMDALIAGAMAERLAGDVRAMEARLRRALTILEELGDIISASKVYSFLADALYLQDRLEEAEAFTLRAEQTALADVDPQVRWRRVRAKLRARQGAFDEAEALARQAVALARQTQLFNSTADAFSDLGEVLRLRGHLLDARSPVEAARSLYLEKGNSVQAEWAARFLDEIPSPRESSK